MVLTWNRADHNVDIELTATMGQEICRFTRFQNKPDDPSWYSSCLIKVREDGYALPWSWISTSFGRT